MLFAKLVKFNSAIECNTPRHPDPLRGYLVKVGAKKDFALRQLDLTVLSAFGLLSPTLLSLSLYIYIYSSFEFGFSIFDNSFFKAPIS